MFFLFGLGYISLVQWYRNRQSLLKYMSELKHAMNHSSSIDLRLKQKCVGMPDFLHLSSLQTCTTSSLLFENERIAVYTFTPKMCLCLSQWNKYDVNLGIRSPSDIHVLAETCASFNPLLQTHTFMEQCIAWNRASDVTGIVFGLDKETFSTICINFAKGIPMNENLNVHRIRSVDLTRSSVLPVSLQPSDILGNSCDTGYLRSFQACDGSETVDTHQACNGSKTVDTHQACDGSKTVDTHQACDGSKTVDTHQACDGAKTMNDQEILIDTFRHRQCRHMFSKPPNILVYCGTIDSKKHFKNMHGTLKACVNSDSYAIYQLPHDQVKNIPWQENTMLLVIVCHVITNGMEDIFENYLYNGGNILSFGSSLEKRFVNVQSIQSDEKLESFKILNKYEDKKFLQGGCTYDDVCLQEEFSVSVMARDQSKDRRPALIGISRREGNTSSVGKAIFSQIHLHMDPTETVLHKSMFEELKDSNAARIEILQHLLSWLGVSCGQSVAGDKLLTAATLLAIDQKTQQLFLASLNARLKDGCVKSLSVTLQFVQASTKASSIFVSSTHLPVICTGQLQCKYFRQQIYWDNLNTTSMGKVVIYADVLPTTMALFEGVQFLIPDSIGLVAIGGRQTSGKGRGGNIWLSPVGCAMFSVLVRIPANSNLGQKISFLQHLTSLAVVHSVTTLTGYEMVNVKLKWPNDIYYSNKVKLGGVLVNSTILGATVYAVIGCGFNVTNSNPTICINDMIMQYNAENASNLLPCSTEQLIARTITQLEKLITDFQTYGHHQFCQQYYKAWLHSGKQVKLETGQEVTVTGVDDFGFLQVQAQDGVVVSLQPDGNTFDMMHNLIRMKKAK